ncbi:MAG: hypothetical protein FWH11_00995 [Micrococcales bacterium]|nr:hypothetical protein [Micrococcales bacterium]
MLPTLDRPGRPPAPARHHVDGYRLTVFATCSQTGPPGRLDRLLVDARPPVITDSGVRRSRLRLLVALPGAATWPSEDTHRSGLPQPGAIDGDQLGCYR